MRSGFTQHMSRKVVLLFEKYAIHFLFALGIFSGSFLLFQVQPIIGKYILPWFGGTSAVWTTALLFFQVLLLFGYFYVFLISKLPIKIQLTLHGLLLITTALLIYCLFTIWQSPIFPDLSLKINDAYSPIIQVLGILTISIGLPYFILSTNSILLQKWYHLIHPTKSPYILYALSNAASLLAIISYPLLIEPLLRLRTQGIWWSLGFLFFSCVILICCLMVFIFGTRHEVQSKHQTDDNRQLHIKSRKLFLWMLLPAVSSVMLISITSQLTLSVAPIPFLWMLPLSLYLLSFILCFSGSKWYNRNFYAYIFLLFAPLAIIFTFVEAPTVLTGIIVYSLVLFSCCMLCHGEAYQNRPVPKQLDIFYLFIALGSAVGAIFTGVLAPIFFKGLWELYIGFYVSYIIAVIVLVKSGNSAFYRRTHIYFSSEQEFYLCAVLLFPVVLAGTYVILTMTSGFSSVKIMRNFYGILTIKEKIINNERVLYFNHGNILHGLQYASGPKRFEPTAYFTKQSGIGRVLGQYPRPKTGLRVAVMGLGIGTLAAYGEKGDVFRFYEINTQVITIAKNNFMYLKDSPAKIDIIPGDARLSIQKELTGPTAKYDVIVMDAFSDDAIPVHLITKEAMEIYLKRLVYPNGVIAVNTTNHYIDLKPVLVQLAEHFSLHCTFIHTPPSTLNFNSNWAILSYSGQYTAMDNNDQPIKSVGLWTDDYSNMLQIIK